ncbi:DDB1- and CUL4-associated factor 11 [Hemitrygon akajei]|uniref:DDB1- and CUL4-associated factor 11 n=1 Tax=Hemitrygon akajei TaxID=2704970 RepID=UPI003BF9892C
MGSRSSSSGSGSSSGFGSAPAGDRRRHTDEQQDSNLAQVLAHLLRRGQVQLVNRGRATGLQLVQTYSDDDEDSDSAWDGCLGDRYHPPGRNLAPVVPDRVPPRQRGL